MTKCIQQCINLNLWDWKLITPGMLGFSFKMIWISDGNICYLSVLFLKIVPTFSLYAHSIWRKKLSGITKEQRKCWVAMIYNSQVNWRKQEKFHQNLSPCLLTNWANKFRVHKVGNIISFLLSWKVCSCEVLCGWSESSLSDSSGHDELKNLIHAKRMM